MKELVVSAGIVWRSGRVLATQRPAGKDLEGWWEFPGGKVEDGETPKEALIRELAEELGLGVRVCLPWKELSHAYEDRGLVVHLHFFNVTAFSGEPCALEGQNIRWITPEQARELPFLPADSEIVDNLRPPMPVCTDAGAVRDGRNA